VPQAGLPFGCGAVDMAKPAPIGLPWQSIDPFTASVQPCRLMLGPPLTRNECKPKTQTGFGTPLIAIAVAAMSQLDLPISARKLVG